METVYLLKSPANAQHLQEAIAEYQAGKTQEHDLISSGLIPRRSRRIISSRAKLIS
jgi:antitoxin YefM